MDLPMNQVERDPNQARKDFGTEGEKNKLKKSIEKYGIEEPLKVSEISENRYIIMDGHRRQVPQI
jgi:ParB-like chromosome segregation protein Spo0J